MRPTARIKQVRSIIEKLNRLPTRLVQLQDVVGLRAVVPNRAAHDAMVEAKTRRPSWAVRATASTHSTAAGQFTPSTRRVAILSRCRSGPPSAVWADLFEAMDRIVAGLKYGTAPADVQTMVAVLGRSVAQVETAESAADEQEATRLARQLMIETAVAAVMIRLRSRNTP